MVLNTAVIYPGAEILMFAYLRPTFSTVKMCWYYILYNKIKRYMSCRVNTIYVNVTNMLYKLYVRSFATFLTFFFIIVIVKFKIFLIFLGKFSIYYCYSQLILLFDYHFRTILAFSGYFFSYNICYIIRFSDWSGITDKQLIKNVICPRGQ